MEQRAQHNHPADVEQIAVCRFKEALRRKAEIDTSPLQTIFMSEALNYPNAMQFVGFTKAVQKMMQRARSEGIPPVPHTLGEMNRSLMNQRY